jgi:hypothetical protein
VSNTEPSAQITGKITASPNPVSFGQCCVISWHTNDPVGAEVRVVTPAGDEQLMSKGRAGQTEVPWIVDSGVYEFRLYARSLPDKVIDSVKVRRDLNCAPVVLSDLAAEALRGNINIVELLRFIAAIIPACQQTHQFRAVFSVLLRQFAQRVMQGHNSSEDVCRFITAELPQYLGSQVAGKIVAMPNPLGFGQGPLTVAWGTTDPTGSELRVLTPSGDEKLISDEPCGEIEVPWITGSGAYELRLYANSRRDIPIDTVTVKRHTVFPALLNELAAEILAENVNLVEIARFIAAVMPMFVHNERIRYCFQIWERHGFHVTPVHFYQPIPDTGCLPETLWNRPSELAGINMNHPMQLDLLRNHFPKFRDEYEQFPTRPTENPAGFYLNNHLFDGADALVAYCMVRHFQPRLVIEVGSGFSSLVLGQAVAKNNNNASLICIEPFPREFLKNGFPGLQSLIESKVQDMDLDFFLQLAAGDILFIDSSHTVKIGGDVNYLFLEVLPRLRPGVLVHIHDIFLPFEYRRDWVKEEHRFWTEQYLLQAFLTFNSEFEVLMANSYLNRYHQSDLKAAFPSLPALGGGSFWMRRTPSA